MDIEPLILVVNCGSSSFKFALHKKSDQACVGNGSITGIGGSHPLLKVKGELFANASHAPMALEGDCKSTTEATILLIKYLQKLLPAGTLAAVGHRVLLGGDMTEHTLLTPALITYLKSLIPLGPLHQPYNLAPVDQIAISHPHVPQVACFDTAFHSTIPVMHRRFGIPRVWHEKGVKRYGFHGLSYEYISGRLKVLSTKAYTGKTIVAHLGSGASMCAFQSGKSHESTMGFSALEGLMMGTRPGHLDAGVILYLLKEGKLDYNALERFLYKESGLLGVSGVSNDMQDLLASTDPNAREAIDLFCHRIRREGGALYSILGGMDSFVFTGGMGEHAPSIRSQVCDLLSWTGIKIDPELNKAAVSGEEVMISTPDSAVDVWVIPTNEEAVIVRHTCALAFPQK